MKTVAAGAHYTTVTVDTAEAVKFSFPSTSLSVEAAGGDITVALTETAQAGDDETITIPDGESRMFIHHRMNVDTYYLIGSGTATLYASNMGDVNPFKGKSKGGDGGGDNTHYKGTTTTPLANGSTTNPIVIDGEDYTAVFGDVVVYGYAEFVFDGTTWSEFGRPFDTAPTGGSTNAVTSDGVYKVTPFKRSNGGNSAILGYGSQITGGGTENSIIAANASRITAINCAAIGGSALLANTPNMMATGIANKPRTGDLFNIGNGTDYNHRSNIVEVNATSMNVNGDIQQNGVPIRATTMPTITASMLGAVVQYVGASDSNYKQGWNYVAVSDGAAEPTYSWVKIGGGRTETVLWENTGTTNPQTITLSEAYTNFDDLIFECVHTTASQLLSSCYLANDVSINTMLYPMYGSEQNYVGYSFANSTTLNYEASNGAYYVFKVIGIKY